VQPFIHRYIPLSIEIENWLRHTVRVPDHKIQRIYNGVNTDRFAPRADGIARPDGAFVIGTVGRMQTVKCQPALAQAFVRLTKMINPSTHPVRLVMVGDGPLRAEVERVVAEAGVAQWVELRGVRDNVPDEMRNMDLFVLPSIAEGISNTILEAMACGLPVVATNVGGNAELVTDGLSGRIVPHSDPEAMAQALHAYVTNPDRAREHGRAGRQRVLRDFSMDRMVSAYTGVYDGLIGADCVAARG
jgi:sugar transferase (PEP-CTERM/EpsH1 system associated)